MFILLYILLIYFNEVIKMYTQINVLSSPVPTKNTIINYFNDLLRDIQSHIISDQMSLVSKASSLNDAYQQLLLQTIMLNNKSQINLEFEEACEFYNTLLKEMVDFLLSIQGKDNTLELRQKKIEFYSNILLRLRQIYII